MRQHAKGDDGDVDDDDIDMAVMAFGAGYTCAEEGGSQVAKAKGRL